MTTPLCTLLNPLTDQTNFFFGQRWMSVRLRHDLVFIVGSDSTQELRFVWLAGHDDHLARVRFVIDYTVFVNKRQTPGGFDSAVTLGAFRVQNRLNVSSKINVLSTSRRGNEKPNDSNGFDRIHEILDRLEMAAILTVPVNLRHLASLYLGQSAASVKINSLGNSNPSKRPSDRWQMLAFVKGDREDLLGTQPEIRNRRKHYQLNFNYRTPYRASQLLAGRMQSNTGRISHLSKIATIQTRHTISPLTPLLPNQPHCP
jgi:hypothetical protein